MNWLSLSLSPENLSHMFSFFCVCVCVIVKQCVWTNILKSDGYDDREEGYPNGTYSTETEDIFFLISTAEGLGFKSKDYKSHKMSLKQ